MWVTRKKIFIMFHFIRFHLKGKIDKSLTLRSLLGKAVMVLTIPSGNSSKERFIRQVTEQNDRHHVFNFNSAAPVARLPTRIAHAYNQTQPYFY